MDTFFQDAANQFKGSLKGYDAFPCAANREAYQTLPQAVKEELLQEGEKYLHYKYPMILATDFMNFKRNGNRVDYEDLYFARRHALAALTLAECIEYQGRFLDDIINGIFLLCEESAWQLPPHNSYFRNETQFILPDATRPVLDLFACETGSMLAWVLYLLQDAFETVSPFLKTRILHELSFRIINPYLQEHFWWMGREGESMNNWTVWCTQNILLTVFLLTATYDDSAEGLPQDRLRQVFQKAAVSCDFFLEEYGEDGCCDEGAQYYRHAGLCLAGCLDVLNNISNQAFHSINHLKKIRNIASYIMNVHVHGRYYINFADCSPVAGHAGVREYLFAKAINHPDMAAFAAIEFQSHHHIYTGALDQINMYYLLQTAFSYQELLDYSVEESPSYSDIFYPSAGLLIVRSKDLCLAAKAGDNNDSHNHNDTGSFTLYKSGHPVFVDIGVESYTQKTFSSRRYEIWTMQSGYHNLPTLMGMDEKDGANYKATKVTASPECDTPVISMELASAYPSIFPQEKLSSCSHARSLTLSDCGLSYQRTINLDKHTEEVVLKDVTNCPDVILNFITYEKPALSNVDGSKGILQIGSLAEASFTGARLLAIETLPITDARLQTAWDRDLYRIRLSMTDTDFHMVIH